MHPVTRLYVAGFLNKCAFQGGPLSLDNMERVDPRLTGITALMDRLKPKADFSHPETMTIEQFRQKFPNHHGGLLPPGVKITPHTPPPGTQMLPGPNSPVPRAPHHALTPEQIQMAQMTGLALPSVLGATIGGIGSFANGGNPIRGAATGLGTGVGWTLGGMAGNVGARALGVTDPTMRALIGLGTSGAGAFFGNRITGGLVGNKKRRYDDE